MINPLKIGLKGDPYRFLIRHSLALGKQMRSTFLSLQTLYGLGGCAVLALPSYASPSEHLVALPVLIEQAIAHDPSLKTAHFREQAVEEKSIAAGTLPDPSISIGMMNLPVDSFDFSQEAMTQLKIGISQMFPRGDVLALKQGQLSLQASRFPLLRAQRKAQLAVAVSLRWLDWYQAANTIKLINNDTILFEQLVDVAKANYSSVTGSTRQQDMIRAELELVQLHDRLTIQQQRKDIAIAALSEWVELSRTMQSAPLSTPTITLAHAGRSLFELSLNEIADLIIEHPALRAIEVDYQVANKEVAVARQQYKPQWGVEASYAWRDDSVDAMNRADFFSVGVTFDLPLFTENRQDKGVSAAIAEAEAVKTERQLQLRKMVADVNTLRQLLHRLMQRKDLYSNQLLSQMQQQTDATLTAYTNDDGSFTEVVRSRIALLNSQLSALEIDVEILKTIVQLNYYLAPNIFGWEQKDGVQP
ncbi:TolC family protein [Alteromonas ponticola]|uniref:TolC family protein n=1 Tax=Alteromonas aquimaris TaxID=2998417 RepID=A0ABT3PAW6_9ALTE|nr:TolC family protein [Alteromonas aquimaris]MCW8109919.1 TolC family protein [Alteromonas aquimaris]